MANRTFASSAPPLGIGYYTVPEAARLLRISATSVRRWLGGYTYTYGGERHRQPPLWCPQLPPADDHLELGFRDLIELRFVAAFLAEGLRLPIIRACLATARELVEDDRPFSTRRFKTDGRRIYLESLARIERAQDADYRSGKNVQIVGACPADAISHRQVMDLKTQQYVFADVIARTFKDLDIDADSVVSWRPFNGKATVVIDPKRAFGQPITSTGAIPTVAIAGALAAEGSEKRVAFLYDIPRPAVRDAVSFESKLAAS